MAEMNMNPREKARLEEEKKNRKTRNKFILVGVIVVLMIALVIFVNSRLFYNVTTALTIGDTNYSVARMNYEYQKAYMNFNQTYGQYFGSLIDTSKSLKEQSCPFDANGGTWDNYFKQSAETNLTQLSAVYAKAIAEGYTLTEDDAAEIDTAVESYRTYGKSLGYATLNKFLSAYFGSGNSEKTIRANMAEELIASRYADDVYASFTYTDDEIDAYYAENADSYDRVNVLYTLISAAANEDEGIDADTAKAAAEDKAKVILAGAGSSEEDFRAAVLKETEAEASETSYTVTSFLSRYEGSVERDDIAEGKVFSHSSDSGVYVVYILGTESNDYPTVNVRHILLRPVYTMDELNEGVVFLDSIANQIRKDSLSFDKAALQFSDDATSKMNGGIVSNHDILERFNAFEAKLTVTKFLREDFAHFGALDDYNALIRLKPGEISPAFLTEDIMGNQLAKIVKLVEIIPTHVASLNEDYLRLEEMALNAKQERVFKEWLTKKIDAMYVYIAPEFRDGEFENKSWVK